MASSGTTGVQTQDGSSGDTALVLFLNLNQEAETIVDVRSNKGLIFVSLLGNAADYGDLAHMGVLFSNVPLHFRLGALFGGHQ
jgi:hypothetical protein